MVRNCGTFRYFITCGIVILALSNYMQFKVTALINALVALINYSLTAIKIQLYLLKQCQH